MRTKFAFISALFLLFIGQVVFAQVTGTVQDDYGPVADAEVTVRGGEASAVTDENGTFSIDAKVGDVLTVTDAMGTAQDFSVTNNNMGAIKFGAAVELETVTLLGGVKVDPAQKVGAYSVVKKEDFEMTPVASIDEVLNGRVAGLSFSTAGGHPGSANLIAIRGAGSLIGTPNPLYVIDGVIVGKGQDNASIMTSWNPLASIDPNMIESVTVLKDASSTALYGARGANGVIVVKTKRGKYNQKTRFRFSSDMSIQDIAYDKQDWMTAEEYVRWGGMTKYNTGGTWGGGGYASMDDAIEAFSTEKGWDGVTNEDWQDAIMRNMSTVNTYSFSVDGGGDNTSFRLGASYYQNKPLVIDTNFDRVSFNSALSHKASDKLALDFTANYTNVSNDTYMDKGFYSNPWNAAWTIAPIYPVYNPDGSYNYSNLGPLMSGTEDGTGSYNFADLLRSNSRKGSVNSFVSSITADWQFVKNLYFNTLFGVQYQRLDEKSFQDWRLGDGPNADDNQDGRGGWIEQATTEQFDWNWNNTLSYRNTFAGKHELEVFAGLEYQEHTYNFLYNYMSDLNRNVPYFYYGTQTTGNQVIDDNREKWVQISYFGRLNYIFNKLYTISGQIRRDSNSTLGVDDKTGLFWSVAASWNINNQFDLGLNELTLRGNYGEIGNIPYADSWGSTYNSFTQMGNSFYGDASNNTIIFSEVGNKYLAWESSNQLNVGLDFGFKNGIFGGSVDYYIRDTENAIFSSFVAPSEGGFGPNGNVATIRNTGLEVTLSSRPFNKEFIWAIDANFAMNEGTVRKMFEPETTFSGYGGKALRQGELFGDFYTVGWAGVNPETGAPQWYTDETESEITENYSDALPYFQGKTPFAKYMGGIRNEFIYKGFSLSAYFTGQFDYYVNNLYSYYIHNDGSNTDINVLTDLLYDSWSPDNPNASNPIQVYGNPNNAVSMGSSRYLRKGDHIRLKEVKLAYTLSNEVLKNNYVDGITFYVRGVNLWTYVFDKDLQFDPETSSNRYGNWADKGIYDNTSLIMKSVSLGIAIDF